MRILFFISCLSLALSASAQQILLMTEDFEAPSNTFAFDTGGLGNTTGTNKWIINNEFDGLSVYPNTTNQDSTVSGTITNAPFSTYLHIHDENTTTAANANYDPSAASDRFVYMDRGFCTLGMVDIVLTFFYVCEGSNDAYGEVYYSIDGGPWIQTGAARYNNQTKWRYVTISEPVFENVTDLRFGFRWVNNAGGPPASISFGLDDIIVVGTYDQLNSPVNITIPQVFPNPICQLNNLIIEWHLSGPLCDGTYRVELSNSIGAFASPTSLGVFGIQTLDTSGFIAATIPGTIPPGNCYKIRIRRISPPPAITGIASACFSIEHCANTITTMTPVVAIDPDTVCSLSAIDIPFTSTGVYNHNNVYIAQLSDSNGNFSVNDTTFTHDTIITAADTVIMPIDTTYIPADTIIAPPDTTYIPADTIITLDTTIILADTTIIHDTIVTPRNVYQVIGNLLSSETYDPSIGAMPGTVSGLLPSTPEGCNYFIRIISTSPSAIGSLYGPFCIKHCDITTNNTLDIHVCIHETVGLDDTVQIEINHWNTDASYLAGNSFIVQLLDMMTLGVVNEGGLGVTFDTASTTLILHVPGLNDLLTLGIAPGVYYMRIIADSSTVPYNDLGTIIRLTIGAPADNPSIIIPDDSVYCNSEIGSFLITPYNPDSDYEWLAAALNNGAPFVWPNNPLLVDWTGAPVDDYTFRVREINYGCVGPYSPPATVFVITLPDVDITGPPTVCQGDTFLYSVSFLPKTYYEWSVSWGRIIDTSNNEIQLVFDSAGSVTLSLYALNICGVRTSDLNIEVVSIVDVDAGNDTTICQGQTIDLQATEAGFNNYVLTTLGGGTGGQGNMFDIKANEDLVITGFDGHFPNTGLRDIAIYYKSGSYVGFERDSTAWTFLGTATGIIPNGSGTATPIPIPLNVAVGAGQTAAFYITTTNGTTQIYTTGTNTGALYATDNLLEFYQGTGNFYPFGSAISPRIWNGIIHYFTEYGISYLWSTGDSTSSIEVTPEQSTAYSVEVSDTNGCRNHDNIQVTVIPLPEAFAGKDTAVCEGTSVQLNATGGDIYSWQENEGLSNSHIPDPIVMLSESTSLIVSVTDSGTGCSANDTVFISASPGEVYLDSALICPDHHDVVLQAPAITGAIYLWNTGETTSSIMVSDSGEYVVAVRQDTLGCVTKWEYKVKFDDCQINIVVPNAFAPSGNNPRFTVFSVGEVDEYDIKIFNRWGEMVYHSSNISELATSAEDRYSKGWDGVYKGKLQNAGVYVYYLKARNNALDTDIEKEGSFILVR